MCQRANGLAMPGGQRSLLLPPVPLGTQMISKTLSTWSRRGEALIKAPLVMGAQGKEAPTKAPKINKNTYSPCMPITYFLRAKKIFLGAKTLPKFFFCAHTTKKFHLKKPQSSSNIHTCSNSRSRKVAARNHKAPAMSTAIAS